MSVSQPASPQPAPSVVTATVALWTNGKQPSSQQVQVLAPAGVSPTDLNTMLIMKFIEDRAQGDPNKLPDLVAAGVKGFLQVVQQATSTLTPPPLWQAPKQ